MDQIAAQFRDNFSHLPVRQRVLQVSKRLHYFRQRDGAPLNSALPIFLPVVEGLCGPEAPTDPNRPQR